MQVKTIRRLHVFISCPEDVKDEKKIVKEVCVQLTDSLKPSKDIEICPIDWKNDIVPVITGEGAQAVIDEQVKDYDYDVYIGIMWKRYGDRKLNGLSHTEHEFENALNRKRKTGRPAIMFLFKSLFNIEDGDKVEQIEQVEAFRKRIENEDPGLYGTFENQKVFRKKILIYLKKIVDNPDLFLQTTVPKKKYPQVTPYLPRKICQKKDYTPMWSSFLVRDIAQDTTEIISNYKRVTFLGDAGVGKTTELRRIAWHFSEDDVPFYPFMIELNKYVNQSIAEFLPLEWDVVPESKRVIILDGLDEIESKNKNDAIRQIELFAEQYPNTRIVVSCRTNFYESDTEGFSGTLNGFSSYMLLELGQKEIEDYVKKALNKKAEDFHTAISNNQLHDFLQIPFYLIRLVGLFKKNNALPSHKAEIFEQLLLDRIQLDVEHYRKKKDLKRKKKTIIQALQRLALGMEVLGRNYITDDEYNKLIENDSLRELIEHCTVWKKDETEATKWKFEHNNFQEYLAAELLSTKPLSTIKELMFFEPDHRKLILSWSSTLSFLIGISDDHDLIQWIIDNEPEHVVKFEPDRVEKNNRINIFKGIFNLYKEKQIWINRDKFRYDELARFGQSDEIVEFVLCEAEKAAHYTTASNAIELVRYLQIPYSQRERTCNLLVNYTLGNEFGDQIQNRALIALADLRLNSLEVINKITKTIRTSESEWIRYGLYYFLHNSDYLDDNIDIFLNGLKYVKLDISSERSRLMDEHWHLRIGIEKAKSPDAIVKIFEYFIEHTQDLDDIIFEKSVSVIAENAANAYFEEPSLFQKAKSLFETFIDTDSNKKTRQFLVFFDKTETRLQVFREYLFKQKDNRQRWTILAILADKVSIEFFVQQYEEGNLKEDDVLTFRNYLGWKNYDLYLPFNDLINAKTGNKFVLHPQRDFDKERKERTQRDINLLFNKKAFLSEFKLIFDTENAESLTNQEILDIQHKHWDKPYFSALAINQLRNLSKEQSMTLDHVVRAVNTWDWDWFCICNVYEKLAHDENITLTNEQKTIIANWCYSNLDKIDFKTALITKSNGSSSTSLLAIFLWYYLRKFNLTYTKEVLLDLLSYDWIEAGQHVGIEYLEALLSKYEITTRILTNLKEGIRNDDVLKNHLDYCKRYKVTEVLPYAMSELANSDRGDDVKRIALDTICELSKTTTNDLEKLLPQIINNFKWNVIEKLVQNNSQVCHKYLLSMLQTANEEEKLKSANYLIELQDLEGLKYYVDWVKRHKQSPETVHFDKSPLLGLRVLEAVPYLIDLLEVSYQPDFVNSGFEHLEYHILDTLTTIALQTDENYQSVRKDMEDFIKNNTGKIKNINFLNIFIEKLDQKYYLAKSEEININDVIAKLEIMSPK